MEHKFVGNVVRGRLWRIMHRFNVSPRRVAAYLTNVGSPEARRRTPSEDTWIAGRRTAAGPRCSRSCRPTSAPLCRRTGRRKSAWPARRSRTRSRWRKRQGRWKSPAGCLTAVSPAARPEAPGSTEEKWTGGRRRVGRLFLTAWPYWNLTRFLDELQTGKCPLHARWWGWVLKHSINWWDSAFSSQHTVHPLPFSAI